MSLELLHSPLAGTAAVLTGIGLLAIPLHRLTNMPATPPPRSASHLETNLTPAVMRLKLLTPARSLRIKTESGDTLLDLRDLAAGESEHDTAVPIHDETLDLLLEADLGDDPADTAVFLTIMPDAMEEQTRYFIGNHKPTEPLHFSWYHH